MPRWTDLQGTSKMKITKTQLRKIIKEELDDYAGDRVEMEKLQTMLYKLEDDFLPFLMNTEEVEIGEAANQLYKLLKARVEG